MVFGELVNPLESSPLNVSGVARCGSPPVRVLAVVPYSDALASMVFVRRQIESLNRLDVKCECFWLRSRTSLRALAQDWRLFRKVLRKFRPDIVHAHFGTVTALFAVLSTSVPVVITYRGSDLNRSPAGFRLRAELGNWISQVAALRARKIICVSEALKQQLRWARCQVMVIPTGVNMCRFKPMQQKEARSALGWSSKGYVVLFNCGRDPLGKDLNLARAAVEAANRRGLEAELLVLDGEICPDLVPTLMNAADCLLVTSKTEGSPNVVKEALACNLPIVSVDVGDVRERLAGVTNCLIAERTPDSLANALQRILALHQRSNGRELAQSISEEAIAAKIQAVYVDMLSASGTGVRPRTKLLNL